MKTVRSFVRTFLAVDEVNQDAGILSGQIIVSNDPRHPRRNLHTFVHARSSRLNSDRINPRTTRVISKNTRNRLEK